MRAGFRRRSPTRPREYAASSGAGRKASDRARCCASALDSLIDCRDFPAPWRRDPFDRDRRIDALLEQLKELGDLAAKSSWPGDYLTRNLAEIARFVEENTQLEAVRGRDYDGLEATLRDLARAKSWKWKGAKRTSFGALSRDEVLSRRDQAKAELDAFIAASDADLAPLLHEELQAAVSAYQDLKSGGRAPRFPRSPDQGA